MQTLRITANPNRTFGDRWKTLANPAYPGDVVSDTSHSLPYLTDDETKDLLDEYNGIVIKLCRLNKDNESWWLTWLSCRDQHNNDLLGNLHSLFRLKKCLNDPLTPSSLTLRCSSPAVAAAAREIAEQAGWRAECGVVDRLIWLARKSILLCAPLVGGLKVFLHGMKLVFAASRYPVPEKNITDRTTVLVTHLPALFQQQKSPYRDAYFGNLGQWLESKGERIAILGQPQGAVFPIANHCRSVDDTTIVTTGHMLNLYDIFALSLGAFFSHLHLQVTIKGFSNLPHLIRESLRHDVLHQGAGLIVKRALQTLLDRNPRARVIHIYENNPWERGVASAAKDRADPRDVTGFLHCAVLPAHLKNIITPEEIPLRPAPDRIVCTGPAARDIFLSLGAHDASKILSGCNLRGPDFSHISSRQGPPSPIHTVLVVLEGLEKMVGFLRFAEHAARLSPQRQFIVRAHPAYPYNRLARLAKIEMGKAAPLQESDITDLQMDLERADAVLYQGSTVALTAGFMGIPLLRFEGNSLLTDDPLFESELLKRRVYKPQDVEHAIREFLSLSETDHRCEAENLKVYILRYLAPPSDQTCNHFMPYTAAT